MVKYTVRSCADCSVVEFTLENGVIDQVDLDAAVAAAPAVDATRGVVLSGRGPVWLFCSLAHHYHATPWVAAFDPRLGGGVVVERHATEAPCIGTVVPA